MSKEILPLPSEGVFYPNNLKYVTVSHLTAEDELFLSTPNNLNNPNCLYLLLKDKIDMGGLSPENLLIGDFNAILLHLRTSAYGQRHTVLLDDEEVELDLNNLEIKKMPGNFKDLLKYKTKKGNVVELKPLTVKDLFDLNTYIDDFRGEIKPIITETIKKYIVSVDENNDRENISSFVDNMLAADSLRLREHIKKLNIGQDNKYNLKGDIFEIPMDATIFGLDLKNADSFTKAVNDEIFVLVKHGKFSDTGVLHMPVFRRKYFITKLYEEAKERRKMEENERNKAKNRKS